MLKPSASDVLYVVLPFCGRHVSALLLAVKQEGTNGFKPPPALWQAHPPLLTTEQHSYCVQAAHAVKKATMAKAVYVCPASI